MLYKYHECGQEGVKDGRYRNIAKLSSKEKRIFEFLDKEIIINVYMSLSVCLSVDC